MEDLKEVEKMTKPQQEYLAYLQRTIRTRPELTIKIANSHKLNREIGKSYGCSEKEMDEVGNDEIR